jgi:K+-sensing histidine kinase KdpD
MSEVVHRKKEEVLERSYERIYMESCNQVISSVTHELRTPLAIISSNIELLKKFRYKADKQVVDTTFYLCQEAISSMTRFVNNVSLLNGFNKEEWRIEQKEIRLTEFFENLRQRFPEHSRQRIRLEMKSTGDLFYSDVRLLEFVFRHLVDNALNFSAEEVLLHIHHSKEGLEVQVKDNGMGISEKEMIHVFEPFYRGSNAKMMSGSGLGLAIVKRCMDLLKGTIQVTSLINQGTTFNVKILNNGFQKNSNYRG